MGTFRILLLPGMFAKVPLLPEVVDGGVSVAKVSDCNALSFLKALSPILVIFVHPVKSAIVMAVQEPRNTAGITVVMVLFFMVNELSDVQLLNRLVAVEWSADIFDKSALSRVVFPAKTALPMLVKAAGFVNIKVTSFPP